MMMTMMMMGGDCDGAADDCTGGNSDNEYEDDGAENDYNDDAYDGRSHLLQRRCL